MILAQNGNIGVAMRMGGSLGGEPAGALSEAERLDRLRLIRSENVGPITFRRLVEQFGSARRALAVLPDLARRGGRKDPVRLCSPAEAEREIKDLERLGGSLIAAGEPGYPLALAHIEDAPPLLSLLGERSMLERPAVGVVGARNASIGGRRLAQAIAADLGRAGFVVVSGLARGIDTAAHEGSLSTGTIAIVAGGVDSIYPRENDSLYKRIVGCGAVVSEMPLGTVARARDFPRRNRLISGLSRGVVVIEAGAKSGSLITARMALDQGREVFAVPGSPLDPRSQGANDLLRQGAILTESAADVLGVLSELSKPSLAEPQSIEFPTTYRELTDETDAERARHRVEEMLSPVPVTVDEVLRNCQISPPVLLLVLLEIELAGRLERHPGHRVSLIQRG